VHRSAPGPGGADVPTYLPTCLPACLPAYLPTPTYLPTYLPIPITAGVGQHRISKIDRSAPGLGGADAPEEGYYAVLVGFAATLETEKGFELLGADGFFDRDGKVVAIVRGGVTYR